MPESKMINVRVGDELLTELDKEVVARKKREGDLSGRAGVIRAAVSFYFAHRKTKLGALPAAKGRP